VNFVGGFGLSKEMMHEFGSPKLQQNNGLTLSIPRSILRA